MGYLLVQLWPWVLGVLALGLLTGWVACSREDE